MRQLLSSLLLCLSVAASASTFPIDFSHVGYMWGEKPIPDYPVQVTLAPPSDGSDATALIQDALDRVKTPGAVLLKAGVYNVSGALVMERDGVVLRGEGDATVLKATGTKKRTLVTVGRQTERVTGKGSLIKEKMTPAGQMWVKVGEPSKFSVGDRVAIHICPNEAWIKGLKMDSITAQGPGRKVTQWEPYTYEQYWERIVTGIKGNKIWLDNPVVMDIDADYVTFAVLEHVTWDRTAGSGVENLRMVSEYDSSVILTNSSGKFKGLRYRGDENHCWSAIDVLAAEHCWVRNVSSAHFAYCLVNMKDGAKNITVRDCISTDPVSELTGSRRYAYHISAGELCLVERCRAEHDRHGFVTGARTPGPNVFLDCVMEHSYADVGPHQRWASGVLYDNCVTDGLIAVQDRAGHGTGHGWAGVSFVFWNCVAETIICQSPWITGKNWCIGCKGKKLAGRKYSDNVVRPDGVWESHGQHVEPVSLYRSQLASFKNTSKGLVFKKDSGGK